MSQAPTELELAAAPPVPLFGLDNDKSMTGIMTGIDALDTKNPHVLYVS